MLIQELGSKSAIEKGEFQQIIDSLRDDIKIYKEQIKQFEEKRLAEGSAEQRDSEAQLKALNEKLQEQLRQLQADVEYANNAAAKAKMDIALVAWDCEQYQEKLVRAQRELAQYRGRSETTELRPPSNSLNK